MHGQLQQKSANTLTIVNADRRPNRYGYAVIIPGIAGATHVVTGVLLIFALNESREGFVLAEWLRLATEPRLWLVPVTLGAWIWFSRRFLGTCNFRTGVAAWLDRALLGLSGLCLTVAGLLLFVDGAAVGWLLAALTALAFSLLAATAAIAIRRGERRAVYYGLAAISLLLGSVASGMGLLAWSPNSPITRYGFALGSAVEWLILLFGLGDRFRLLKEEQFAARETARLKDAFLASMSHELRTPLNALLGMSDLLDTAPLDQEHRNYLEVIRQSGTSMLAMVDNILDILSIEAGTMQLESIPFDIRRTVRDACRAAAEQAQQRGVLFQLDVASATPHGVRGDPARLKQVLHCLLDNAVKFTDQGRIHVLVRPVLSDFAADEDAQGPVGLEFSVSDTGTGIAPERFGAIFDSFTRADDSDNRRHGGLGIGLTVARQLVRVMGGHLEVQSKIGVGTSFRFAVELERAPEVRAYARFDRIPARAQAARTGDDGRDHAADPQNQLAILLVEDNRDNRLLFHAYIKATDHQVEVAENGRMAVQKFKDRPYDIVFMDIQMPEQDGISATREIRAWEAEAVDRGARLRRVPIYALTAHSLAGEIARSIEAGCDGHITKPVRKEEILSLLHDL